MYKIVFNHNCVGWTRNDELNEKFLIANSEYIAELLTYRGYVYLNEIYERLGVTWDPTMENVCYRVDDCELHITIGPSDLEGARLITIEH